MGVRFCAYSRFSFFVCWPTVWSHKANFRHGCHLICHGKTKLTRITSALTQITMNEGVHTRAWCHTTRGLRWVTLLIVEYLALRQQTDRPLDQLDPNLPF